MSDVQDALDSLSASIGAIEYRRNEDTGQIEMWSVNTDGEQLVANALSNNTWISGYSDAMTVDGDMHFSFNGSALNTKAINPEVEALKDEVHELKERIAKLEMLLTEN